MRRRDGFNLYGLHGRREQLKRNRPGHSAEIMWQAWAGSLTGKSLTTVAGGSQV
jgi:hypothetical protein